MKDWWQHCESAPSIATKHRQLAILSGEDSMAVIRTPITANPVVVPAKVSAGQFLHFVLDAGGPIPIFSFASDVKGVLFQAADFPGHPLATYEWLHLQNPSDIQQGERLELGLLFATNANYTYTVELRTAAGLVSTVMKISYVGAPTDIENESFTVVIS